MANIMEKYVSETAEVAAPDSESAITLKRRRWFEEQELRAIKRLTKALRKRNRLLEQEIELRKAEMEARQQNVKEDAEKRKKTEDRKGFFGTLGKEIGRVLPKIVTAVVTGVLGFFFKHRTPRSALQAA